MKIEIKQITATDKRIIGMDCESKVYLWDVSTCEWKLHGNKPKKVIQHKNKKVEVITKKNNKKQ